MKLLHTSDWHLGKVLMGVSRKPDSIRTFEEIRDIAKGERPDLILHTGDVFDTYRPSYEDLQLGIEMLRELSDIAPTIVLCGNHDSPALFRLFQRLLGNDRRLIFVDQARRPEDGGILDFETPDLERIRIAPLPFVSNRIVDRFLDPSLWMATYADKINVLERELGRGLLNDYRSDRDVLIFAAHLYVSGALTSRSERPLHISDEYEAKLDSTPPVTYAAFGHIHRPQRLPTNRTVARYAGSPIPIDFGEEQERKSVVIVEARPGAPAETRLIDLSGGRPLRKLLGTVGELIVLGPEVGDALCDVTLRTDKPEPDASAIVAAALPGATILRTSNDYPGARAEAIDAGDTAAKDEDLPTMFRAYAAEQPVPGVDGESLARMFDRVWLAAESREAPHFEELGANIEGMTA